MRSAQIVRRFVKSEWGGTETVVLNTSLVLKAFGDDPQILATTALDATKREEMQGLDVRRFPYFYPNFPMTSAKRFALDCKGGNPYTRQLYNVLLNENFDVLHLHTGARLSQMGISVARRKKIPCVLSLHGGYADVPTQEIQEMMKPLRHTFPYGNIIDRILGWRRDVISAMDGIICVGRNEFERLTEIYPDKNIIYQPNGVNVSRYSKRATENIRSLWGIPENRKIILCVSRIDYQKNQMALIELLAETTASGEENHLLLIGPITASWYLTELQQAIERNSLQNRVTIVPGLQADDSKLLAAFQQSDVFVLASQHEPFGIVALEAWAAGLPVIASKVGGLQYLISDCKTGLLFDVRKKEALFSAWRELTITKGLRESLINAASREVQEYSWENIVGKQKTFYEELINAKSTSAFYR